VNRRRADPPVPMTARGTRWPIFVLSLEGDEARRAPLLASLAEMGLEAEVLIGVDGRRGLPAWAEAEVDRNRNWTLHRPRRPMTDGELACALSHVRAYRKIIDEGLPGAVVFEDDAILSKSFEHFFAAHGFDAGEIVLLGHEEAWVRPYSKKHLCEGVDGYRLVNAPVFAHAYCLSHAAAACLIRKSTPVRAPADWPCDISRLNSLAVSPQIAFQPYDRKATSHLEKDRSFANLQKRLQKQKFRYVSVAYWNRMLRKRLEPGRIRKIFGRRIS